MSFPMLLSLEWQKCWEMFRQRSLMFAAYFPYEASESATLFFVDNNSNEGGDGK